MALSAAMNIFITAAPANKITGSKAVPILVARLGISSSVNLLPLNKDFKGLVLYYFSVWAKIGPPRMMAGTPVMKNKQKLAMPSTRLVIAQPLLAVAGRAGNWLGSGTAG